MTTAQHVAQVLLDIDAVKLNVQEPFRYTSGILSPIYCDNRVIPSFPQERKVVIEGLAALIAEHTISYDMLGGTATAGIPHAAFLAAYLDKPMVYIRTKPKEHGTGKQVEGYMKAGQRVLIVEDLISTGGSAINSAKGVQNDGGIVDTVIAIFSYEMAAAADNFASAGLTLHSLCTFATLMDVAEASGRISADDKAVALEWNHNPAAWGKNHGFE